MEARDNMTKYLSGENSTNPNNEIDYQSSTESLEIAKSNLKKSILKSLER